MTQTELYFLSMIAIIAVCLVVGFLSGWSCGMVLGYRQAIADATPSSLITRHSSLPEAK